ncbi:MAG: hypothetical protein AAF802_17620 [Planctomycetota bacterium]
MGLFNNQQDARTETVESAWSLEAFPDAGETPSVEDIASLSRSKRRKQRRMLGSLSACVVLLACGISVMQWNQQEVAGTATQVTPSPVVVQPSIVQVVPRVEEPISVYARVRAEVPVFASDPETGRYIPVGWVETRDVVPVETETLSAAELDRLRFLLANKQLLDGC